MVALGFMSGLPAYLIPVLDAAPLCVVVLPLLYVLVLRPLTLFIAEHQTRIGKIERKISELRRIKT